MRLKITPDYTAIIFIMDGTISSFIMNVLFVVSEDNLYPADYPIL